MASEKESRKKIEEINKVEGFSPSTLAITIDESKHLPVKERISWFRLLYPQGTITTELVKIAEISGRQSVVKATVSNGETVLGTGYGSAMYNPETDFGKAHVECAETKAIGRALSSAGFGTQFTDDYDLPEGDIVDKGVPIETPEKQEQVKENTEKTVKRTRKTTKSTDKDSNVATVAPEKAVEASDTTPADNKGSETKKADTGEKSDEEKKFEKKVLMLENNIDAKMSKGISITYGPEPHKTVAETYKAETNEDKLFTLRKYAYPDTIEGANPSVVAACRVFIKAIESSLKK